MLSPMLDAAFARRYDHLSNRRAMQALHRLQAIDGSTIPRHLRRAADAYAADVFGSKAFAPWLYVYAKRRGSFVDGWIPENFYARVVVPNVNGVLRFTPRIKTFTSTVFASLLVPDVGYVIAGQVYGPDLALLAHAEVRDVLFAHGDEVIVKRDESSGGHDVFFVHADDFDLHALLRDAPNAVVQRRIDHHPVFNDLSGAEGSNLRVFTVRLPDGTMEVRVATLRVGNEGGRIVGAVGGYYAVIDATSGRFTEGFRAPDWRVLQRLPGSRRALGSGPVPGLWNAFAACLSLHARVPHLGVIGWDVMVDAEERPWVIEWNARYAAIFAPEAFHGPLFRGLNWEQLRPIRRTWLF